MGAAVPQRPRRALKLWHRWFGLIAGLWLALLAATGIAVTFYDELDIALNADWRTVPASARAAPIDDMIAEAQRALPDFAPNMIELPHNPNDSLWMMGPALVMAACVRSRYSSIRATDRCSAGAKAGRPIPIDGMP
ncbi:PepSY domain-containing protein [Sphingobium sp. RAC03]|uniref:PepSY domain-containing protein n=1 Tax=Sphingobium sp. RAC03 TaxID=1843368 RepID=UPI00083D411A|nr:PepSY domain-containing protein [Sphingobium sp. RAC03]AOF94554.1 pepSY-associated TM helix family protein [Sphingobium sp. RAC03]